MNVNDQIKMKVLAGLRKHMDSRMGERLKPKKALEIDSVKVAPAEAALGDPKMPLMNGAPGGAPDLDHDDAHRLMSLYSSLK